MNIFKVYQHKLVLACDELEQLKFLPSTVDSLLAGLQEGHLDHKNPCHLFPKVFFGKSAVRNQSECLIQVHQENRCLTVMWCFGLWLKVSKICKC